MCERRVQCTWAPWPALLLLAILGAACGGGTGGGSRDYVAVADVTFDATSRDLASHDLALQLSPGAIWQLPGYGPLQGNACTYIFREDEYLGVATWELREEVLAEPVVHRQLARARNGGIYVLRVEEGGVATFASGGGIPPRVFMPASLAAGTSWTSGSATHTVAGTSTSSPGGLAGCYEVEVRGPGSDETRYWKPGYGLVERVFAAGEGLRMDVLAGAEVFADDFGTDLGYATSSSTDFLIDTAAGVLRWHARRSVNQYMHKPLPAPITGDVSFEAVAEVNSFTNNCEFEMGLSESDAQLYPGRPPYGLYVSIGWVGGGTYDLRFHVQARYHHSDDTFTYLTRDGELGAPNSFDDEVWIWPDHAYRIVMSLRGHVATVMVYDPATGLPMGTLTRDLPSPVGSFTHVWFGNARLRDWPEATGKVDSFRVVEPD